MHIIFPIVVYKWLPISRRENSVDQAIDVGMGHGPVVLYGKFYSSIG